MGGRPQISFVVPAFNEERLLPRCIAAIQAEMARTPCTAELLVVDNASSDGTSAVALAAGAQLVFQPHRGLVQARKAGFEAASGELIANIDADTVLPPGWLAHVIKEFDRDRHLVTLSGPYDYYDVAPHIRWSARLFYIFAFAMYLVNRHILRVGSMVQGGNFVLRREALEQAGGFDERFSFYGEDTDIARRMSQVGRVIFSWRLMAQSSGRRLNGDGLLMTGLRYSMNYLWTTFLRRPFTTAWTDYR
ncbi:MAG: glycosyltransferase family 2 protein [Janthinobacterium lividum]